jgi:hypothetical protein
MEGTPTQAEALARVLEARLRDLHVALPGRVESYDSAKQTATITPMVRRVMPGTSEDSPDVMEDLPGLQSVPVEWMEAGDFYIHLPLKAGDTGLLIFNQWDPSRWRTSGEVSDPVDHRLHHPAHAVFLPGYKTAARAISGLPASDMVMGKRGGLQIKVTSARMEVGGATDAAALSSKLDAILNILSTWVVAPNDGGAALQVAINAWKVLNPGTTGSTKLKVGG